MGRSRRRTKSQALILSDTPERVRLRAVQAQLDQRRDQIAEVDLTIETLRDKLASFEAYYASRLAEENTTLQHIEALVRHLERWIEILGQESRRDVGVKGRRVERRREHELAAARGKMSEPEAEAQSEAELHREPAEELKAAYRALARRYHPDLARTEEDRLKMSQLMTRINALYRAGDLDRLLALAEQAKGGEIEDGDVSVEEQTKLLEERLAWFGTVLANLREEHEALEASPTCELWRNIEQAKALGRDLIAEIREELREQVIKAYDNIHHAVHGLEDAVSEYNRRGAAASGLTLRSRKASSLQRCFDPFADKRLVRLGLEQLNTLQVSPQARQLADWIVAEGPGKPALLRLLLLAYVSELSPLPLPGLEGYEDLTLRFDFLGRDDPALQTLEEALVDADDLIEYGVRRATDKLAYLGLRFRRVDVREAVLVSLRSLPIRQAFKRVLSVLGEHTSCPGCNREIFAVPLYHSRGLDNLRASVCPECGHTLQRYWMPMGKDIQAVLNTAYLDFELVSEWSLRLARASVGMQLLPVQVDAMHVGDLKTRFVEDFLARYELGLVPEHVALCQKGAPVGERTPLAELDSRSFTIRFASDAPVKEPEALELLRHRIRNRFRAE